MFVKSVTCANCIGRSRRQSVIFHGFFDIFEYITHTPRMLVCSQLPPLGNFWCFSQFLIVAAVAGVM